MTSPTPGSPAAGAPPGPPARRVPAWALALVGVALVVVIVLVAVLLGEDGGGGELQLEPAGAAGADPFTEDVSSPLGLLAGAGDEPSDAADPRLTVYEEPTWVATLRDLDQADTSLEAVVERIGSSLELLEVDVHYLDGSAYESLPPGRWIAATGPFADEGEAAAACDDLPRPVPACEALLVDGLLPAEPDAGPPPPDPGEDGAVAGGEAALYAGTLGASSCDAARLVDQLEADPDRLAAWAEAQGIEPDEVADYVGSLTGVTLRVDTAVTNHRFADGSQQGFGAVLEAGTDVLVDERGVPRVRCACGNPLAEPSEDTVAQVADGAVATTGDAWDGFEADAVTTVDASDDDLQAVSLVDQRSGRPVERPVGTAGGEDAVVDDEAEGEAQTCDDLASVVEVPDQAAEVGLACEGSVGVLVGVADEGGVFHQVWLLDGEGMWARQEAAGGLAVEDLLAAGADEQLATSVCTTAFTDLYGEGSDLLATVTAPGGDCSTEEPADPPTLGIVWAPNQQGFGEVEPSTVYAGGSPTGLVDDVVWESWGGEEARGEGTGSWVPPGGATADSLPERAIVVASDLGDCNGQLAYRQVVWWFPDRGETEADAIGYGAPDDPFEICTPGG